MIRKIAAAVLTAAALTASVAGIAAAAPTHGTPRADVMCCTHH